MIYTPSRPSKWDKKINSILKERVKFFIGSGVVTKFRGEDGTSIIFSGSGDVLFLIKKMNNCKHMHLKNMAMSQIVCLYESY